MSPSTNARAALAAIACVVSVSACSGAPPSSLLPPAGADAGAVATTSALDVRLATRDAWLDDAQWTQLYVMASAAGRPDAPQAAARLSRADDAIADAAAPFIGPTQATALGALLRGRADDMRALVDARLRGDPRAVVVATAAWYRGSDAIASFVASLGPAWPLAGLETELRAEALAMMDEVSAAFADDRAGEVTAAARAEQHALAVADLFAAGLAAEYPERIVTSALPGAQQAFELELRPMLQDRAFWTRVAVVQHTGGESAQAALDRALEIDRGVAGVLTTVLPSSLGPAIELGLHEQPTDAYAYVLAFESEDPTAPSAAQANWYADVDRFATLLSSAGAYFLFDEVRTVLRGGADATIAETNARRSSDWPLDVAAYDVAVRRARDLSHTFAVGLAAASLPQPR